MRRTTLCTFVVSIALMGTIYAERTPDGACDGLEGDAWGLCNSYCYAMDCDGDRNTSGRECARVADNFLRLTGEDSMPCEAPVNPTGSPTGSCPCNFDAQFWTEKEQILHSSDIPICTGTADPSTCIECGINTMSASTTFLSVLVNLWTDGFSSQEDKIFFFTTEPSPLLEGACSADVSFASGYSYTTPTPDGELPVTSEEFEACAADIGALQSAYTAMCSR